MSDFTVTPVINLNGTKASVLLEENLLAIAAMRSAISTLQMAAPNGRDYQTVKPEVFAMAQRQHAARLELLETVMGELEEIAEHLSDHV